MYRVATCLLGIMFVALLAAPAASDEASSPELVYSPWTQICIGQACFVGKDVRTECGLVANITLSEKTGEAAKKLHVTLPSHVNVERGVRLTIDQGSAISSSFAGCNRGMCRAESKADTELVGRLKRGSTLVLDAMDAAGAPVTVTLPLAGFAEAYDGPSKSPLVLEELHRSPEEIRKLNAAEEARKARCERAKPLP